MKILILTTLMALSFSGLHAQQGPNEERLKAERDKYLKEQLKLSESSEKKFFDLYEEFNDKKRDLRIEMSQNKLGLRKSSLDDKEAKKIIDRELELKLAMVNLEKDYVAKFLTVISPQQLIELYKSEDEFNRIMMQRLRNREPGGQGQGRKGGMGHEPMHGERF